MCITLIRMTSTQRKELGNIVEQKILEFFGDPDSGLTIKRRFLNTLRRNMQKSQKLISHADVLKRYGLR